MGNNADKEKRLALELLHSVIGAKRKAATFNKIFESLMKRHIELCVDLKDHLTAKDGLHQYRNLCQVVSYFLNKNILFVSFSCYFMNIFYLNYEIIISQTYRLIPTLWNQL